MNKQDQVALDKIAQHCEKIISYCSNIKTADEFCNNAPIAEACAFNILQIGELANSGLSDKLKEEMDGIPWKEIYGLRNRIVHGYDGVKLNILFDTIKDDIPTLLIEIKEKQQPKKKRAT